MAVKTAPAKEKVAEPSRAELHAALGRSASAWPGIISGLEERFSPLELEWRPSKLQFGRMAAVRHKDRTLVYLMPMAGQLLVGVVLNEKGYGRALASNLRPAIKQMLAEVTPTAEGRGIRFVVKTEADVAEVVTLARCVMKGP